MVTLDNQGLSRGRLYSHGNMQDQTTQLDQDAVNLAKAIRQTESGGDFKARGKSGEYGAYQFTPPTWDSYSKKHGINARLEEATPEQQNEVAYKQIKEWKDQGYNPGQIASLWNSGKPDAYLDTSYKGKNKLGVSYDVPKYAESVAKAYQQIKAGGQVGVDPQNPSSIANTTPIEKPQGEGLLGGIVSSITDPISQLGGTLKNISEQGGAYIGHLLGGNGNVAPITQVGGLTGNKVDTLGYLNNERLSGIDTTKQVVGNVLQNASNMILPEGKEALAAAGVLRKAYQGAKTFGKIGALQGGGQALEEGKSVKEAGGQALESGLTSGLLGGGLGIAGGLLSKGANTIKDSGILQGTKGIGERAKQEFVSAVDSGLGKHGKGTGETMFDYGIDHNQTGNDAAYQIRNEIADKAENNLTEILKGQNNYTPVNQWLSESFGNIKSGTGNYGAIKKYIENHIQDVIENDPKYKSILIKDAQGRLSLPDWALNELKQQNWVNSRFNPLGDPSSTIKAEANQAMGRAGRKIIENNTKGINVGDYNKELGRLYNAADILEKKGDKPIFSEKSSHFISKILGGMVGSHQGVIGALVGAQTADILASQLAKVPMYLRKEIAQKFAQKGKSQLFDDAVTLLDKMEKDNMGRLALPAPKQMPIYAGAGKAKTYKPEITQAKKGLVGQNPKTGKFFGTYTSESK